MLKERRDRDIKFRKEFKERTGVDPIKNVT